MVSFMLYFKSIKRFLSLFTLTVLMAACSQEAILNEPSGQSTATVESIQVVDYQVVGDRAELRISADLAVTLDQDLMSAAMRGVPLSFVYEVKVTEPRWYVFENVLAHQSRQWLINYQPLLRQWSVDNGKRVSQEISLEDSLQYISSNNTMSLMLPPLEADKQYSAELKLHLDTTQLPGAFKFDLFNFRSVWSLSSEWQKLIFQTSTLKSSD
ncbi:MAG: DUF4390 domain-containing protein [Alcaligenaceae bacterium]|nr:DUF4390 domain-containing protein [Alcaligenaceae bacterium]